MGRAAPLDQDIDNLQYFSRPANRMHKKTAQRAVFSAKPALLQAGHRLNRSQYLVIRAGGAGTFRRHRVDTGDGVLEQAIESAGSTGTGLPGSAITDGGSAHGRCSGTMAGAAVCRDDFIAAARATAGRCAGYCAHTFAFFALDADFTYRLQSLGDFVIGRSLSAHSPQGQYGSLCRQHLLDQVHGTPSLWLVTLAATVSRAVASITVRPAGRNNPSCRRGIGLSAQAESLGQLRSWPA